MKSSVNIIATDPNGKKIQKAITDINPNASTAQLRDFVQNLNGLTNNTLGTPVRIDRTELVDESQLLDRTMSLNTGGKYTYTINEILALCDDSENLGYYDFGLAITGLEGITASTTVYPYLKQNNTAFPFQVSTYEHGNTLAFHAIIALTTEQYDSYFKLTTTDEKFTPPLTGTIVIAIDAGDGYKSAEVTLTITE